MAIDGDQSSERPLRIKSVNDSYIPTVLDYTQKEIDFYVHRKGIYIFILRRSLINPIETLRPILNRAWIQKGSLNVYVLTDSGAITFDPFAFDLKRSTYGVGVSIEYRRNLYELFKNLNGYPIRI